MVEHEQPFAIPVMMDGWACRYKHLENGKRQIISLFLPGDLCQPFGMLPRFMEHALGALTPVSYSLLSPERLRELAKSNTRIEEALWWDALASMAMMHERVVSLGRRSAVERVGHLFCELHHRLTMIGRVENGSFELPLTQSDIADLLGLSAVHVNRSLQYLRGRNLIALRRSHLTVLDLQELESLSAFDPAFLHLDERV